MKPAFLVQALQRFGPALGLSQFLIVEMWLELPVLLATVQRSLWSANCWKDDVSRAKLVPRPVPLPLPSRAESQFPPTRTRQWEAPGCPRRFVALAERPAALQIQHCVR